MNGRVLALMLVMVGCGERLEPCQADAAELSSGGDRTRVVRIDGDVGVTAQLVLPWGDEPRYEEDPAVVFVHGSWTPEGVPVQESRGQLVPGHGLVVVYLNYPGGDGLFATPGTDDVRGPEARAAVAEALQYAAGNLVDTEGCSLADRTLHGVASELALASFSNGGNLAWATLADEALTIPDIVGVASFETPSASQFALVEPGSDEPSPLEGPCIFDASTGVVCDYDYSPLAYDPGVESDRGGAVVLDANLDGVWSEGEWTLPRMFAPGGEGWVLSVPARGAVEQAGLALAGRYLDTDATAEFWAVRTAPLSMSVAAARLPGLAGIETGTEIDHVLVPLDDHPHVVGMVAAMEAAGVWARLHADSAYVTQVAPDAPTPTETRANAGWGSGPWDAAMQPEDDASVQGKHYLTAAVLELLDRAAADDWSDDIDAPLAGTPL